MKNLAKFKLLLLLMPFILMAKEPGSPTAAISLSQLADKADVIVLAQVRDTDYLYRHNYPVGGTAYLSILISYKGDRSTGIIEVYEKGLHPGECYFPNPTVFEEGRRYLLFLKRDPEHALRYRGLSEGCALDVLVDADNRYVLRAPVDGINLFDAPDELAVEKSFTDPYAIENEDTLSTERRIELQKSGWIRAYDSDTTDTDPTDRRSARRTGISGKWIYTRGIELEEVRKRMQLKAAQDQSLRDESGYDPVTGLVSTAARQFHAIIDDKGGQQFIQRFHHFGFTPDFERPVFTNRFEPFGFDISSDDAGKHPA